MAQHIDEVVRIDGEAFAEMGRAYAPGSWNAENFLMDLPHKWDLSMLVLLNGKVAGFWVLATVGDSCAFIYRVAFDASARGRGVAANSFHALREHVARQADRIDVTEMALEVSMGNQVARRFYSRLGFTVCQGLQLREFLQRISSRRSRIVEIGEDSFATAEGAREIVMTMPVASR